MELEKIAKEVRKGKRLEDILKNFDWKSFENFVREIFEANNFFVRQNFVFKTNKKYEIDLIASRGNFVLCADCKSWSFRKPKKSKLREAVKKGEERVKELKKFLRKNSMMRAKLKIKPGDKFKPIIITLLEENLIKEGRSLIIPVFKLNTFLADFEKFFNFK